MHNIRQKCANSVLVAFYVVLLLRGRKNFIWFTIFQQTKFSFQSFSLTFIFKIVLTFPNFSLDTFIKHIILKKKECMKLLTRRRGFSHWETEPFRSLAEISKSQVYVTFTWSVKRMILPGLKCQPSSRAWWGRSRENLPVD